MHDYDVITVEPHEQVVVAVVQNPRLTVETAAQLEHEASYASGERPNLPFVLDFSKVTFAPSVALGALAVLFKGFKLANRRAFLVGVTTPVQRVLSVTRLDSFINVYGSRGTVHVGWKESKNKQSGSPDWVVFGRGYDKAQALRHQLDNFCQTLRGDAQLLIGPEDAIASVEVVEAAYRSLGQSRWQPVTRPGASAEPLRVPRDSPRARSA